MSGVVVSLGSVWFGGVGVPLVGSFGFGYVVSGLVVSVSGLGMIFRVWLCRFRVWVCGLGFGYGVSGLVW